MACGYIACEFVIHELFDRVVTKVETFGNCNEGSPQIVQHERYARGPDHALGLALRLDQGVIQRLTSFFTEPAKEAQQALD